jgi:hypothetical protein
LELKYTHIGSKEYSDIIEDKISFDKMLREVLQGIRSMNIEQYTGLVS